MRPCFTFTAATAEKPAVLAIDDEIGFWGTQAKDFRAALDSVQGQNLIVDVNSPGGEVFAGLGIYNMLRSWAKDGKTVTTRVSGVAASIASVIVLAGDKRQMPKNAFAMIHSPSSMAWGTEEDLREAADVLAKIKSSMRGVYMDRMGVDEAKADELLAKDTWLTADEAKEAGFATEITDAVEATARFDTGRLDLPAAASLFKPKAAVEPPVKTEPLFEQIEALAKGAGFEAHAGDLVLSCETLEQAKARVADLSAIKALCTVAGKTDSFAAFARSNKSVADVRAALLKARADADPEIDNSNPNPHQPVPAATSHNPTSIWAKIKAQSQPKGR